MKKWIPNAITILNLLCGCVASLYAFNDQLIMAGIFVGLGIFFDFFDGLAARLLNASGELGKQLDSLADMVTSGVVPGIVMYQLLSDAVGMDLFTESVNYTLGSDQYFISHPFLCVIGFSITAASCYRLAKFNIDTRQTDSFIGLPTPANAMLIISLGIIAQTTSIDWVYAALDNPYVLLVITFISSFLLNAELPLFALKFKNYGWKKNQLRWVFIAVAVTLMVLLKIYAIPIVILLYVILSMLSNIMSSKKVTA